MMTSFKDFISSFKQIEPLSNFQILDIAARLKIKNFRGVFMRDELSSPGMSKQESEDSEQLNEYCLILNLDSSDNSGSHWTCLVVKKDSGIYFDPYGFCPPLEVEKYCIAMKNRMYSSFRIQKANSVICGHYCLYFLFKVSNCGEAVLKVIDELYNCSV